MIYVIFFSLFVGHKMLKAGILNHLLVRMNDKSSLDTSVKLEKNSEKINENIIAINILLLLMESIFPPQTLPEALKKLPAPSPAAMRFKLYNHSK